MDEKQDRRKYLSGDGRSNAVHVAPLGVAGSGMVGYVWQKTVVPVTVNADNSLTVGEGVPLGIPPTTGRDILHSGGTRSLGRLVYLDTSDGTRTLRVGECSLQGGRMVTTPAGVISTNVLWDTYHADRTQEWCSLVAHAEWPDFGGDRGIYVTVFPVGTKTRIATFTHAPSFIRVWALHDERYLLLYPASPTTYTLHLLAYDPQTHAVRSLATATQKQKGDRAFLLRLNAGTHRFLLNSWHDGRVVGYDIAHDRLDTFTNGFPLTVEGLHEVYAGEYLATDGTLRTATGTTVKLTTGFPAISNVSGMIPLDTGRVLLWRDFVGREDQGFIFLEAGNVHTALQFQVYDVSSL